MFTRASDKVRSDIVGIALRSVSPSPMRPLVILLHLSTKSFVNGFFCKSSGIH